MERCRDCGEEMFGHEEIKCSDCVKDDKLGLGRDR